MALAALTLPAAAATAAAAAPAPPRLHSGAEQAWAVGLAPHARVRVISSPGDRTLQRARADAQGGVLFRGLRAGARVALVDADARSNPVTVHSHPPQPPTTRLYDQRLRPGYGYLTTRDGTRLAIDVHLPHPVDATSLLGGGALAQNASIVRARSPYPTLVEYSGYGYADPAGPINGIARLANLLGFAVVDVQMRGTGCSGGAYDYFDADESLDGYDAIETVARQPWVLDHRVGMLGISYGGISQLFVGALDPPALEAIAPLSPIDSTLTTLYPGGDLNTGFATSWAHQRVLDARPFARTADQAYALARIRHGDRVCRADQALHGEAVDLTREIATERYFQPGFDDPLDPVTFVHRIHVPTFLACQFTDEQVGGHCPDLAQDFSGTRRAWFTFTNGTHIDSLDPETLTRMVDFDELYVAHRRPVLNVDLGPGQTSHVGFATALPLIGGTLLKMVMGIDGASLHGIPHDPVEAARTYAAARRAFDATPRVTIDFDNGAAPGNAPGIPLPAFAIGASRYPLPSTRAQAWYLGDDGALTDAPDAGAGADTFTYRAREGTVVDYHGNTGAGGLWGLRPHYDWVSPRAGQAVAYVTAPLTHTTVVVGEGSVSLWLESTARAPDLQATITEVRPDGREVYVQNGYLRGDASALAPGSTPLAPTLSLRRAQLRPLSATRFTHVTIPLYAEGHVYRAGSRIRVIVSSIGGDQPIWSFGRPTAAGTAQITVAHSPTMDSALTLPVVPGISVPTGLPSDCGALRGEPCRAYAPFANDGT